jgi:hypothetical protein
VDPKGDTPKSVNRFLKEHQMTGRMEYLIGFLPQLERTALPNRAEQARLERGVCGD